MGDDGPGRGGGGGGGGGGWEVVVYESCPWCNVLPLRLVVEIGTINGRRLVIGAEGCVHFCLNGSSYKDAVFVTACVAHSNHTCATQLRIFGRNCTFFKSRSRVP